MSTRPLPGCCATLCVTIAHAQFLDGFYLSRIGIRILIGQHIALHEDQKTDHIGAALAITDAATLFTCCALVLQ